jgi:8-oxo-dGTP diphosphatase
MKSQFHHIVRGILIKDGKLLVAHYKGHHCFLPGGHIELGESVENALRREWEEELGATCSIEKFLGVIENQWRDGDTLHYEINHVFKVNSDQLKVETPPRSRESHLEFYWIVPTEENLKSYKVMPDSAIQKLMKKIQEQDIETCWVSTL